MNPFLKAAKELVNKHGVSSTFTVVTEGVYNADTLSTTNTTTNYTVKLFKNHIKTSQYNFPNLCLLYTSTLPTKPMMCRSRWSGYH